MQDKEIKTINSSKAVESSEVTPQQIKTDIEIDLKLATVKQGNNDAKDKLEASPDISSTLTLPTTTIESNPSPLPTPIASSTPDSNLSSSASSSPSTIVSTNSTSFSPSSTALSSSTSPDIKETKELEEIRRYKLAAEQGDADAQNTLGTIYKEGRSGVEPNQEEAIKFYRMAAKQGHYTAKENLLFGFKIYQRTENASPPLTDEPSDAKTQYELGVRYEKGDGVEKDLKKAFMFYELAAQQNNAEGEYSLGVCYEQSKGVRKDLFIAKMLYEMAADKDHTEAQCKLGDWYNEGLGIGNKNPEKAVSLYRLAANKGLAEAQCKLGACYEKGDGVEEDQKQAIRLYQLAAQQGHAGAQYNLGLCYEDGDGVEKDLKEAARLYQLAVDKGYVEARYNLALCYVKGHGVKQDPQKASMLYRSAADCYEKGHGVEKDLEEAFRLYGLAAALDDDSAEDLGDCYRYGKGVEQDLMQAAKWYELAAIANSSAKSKLIALGQIISSTHTPDSNPTSSASSPSSAFPPDIKELQTKLAEFEALFDMRDEFKSAQAYRHFSTRWPKFGLFWDTVKDSNPIDEEIANRFDRLTLLWFKQQFNVIERNPTDFMPLNRLTTAFESWIPRSREMTDHKANLDTQTIRPIRRLFSIKLREEKKLPKCLRPSMVTADYEVNRLADLWMEDVREKTNQTNSKAFKEQFKYFDDYLTSEGEIIPGKEADFKKQWDTEFGPFLNKRRHEIIHHQDLQPQALSIEIAFLKNELQRLRGDTDKKENRKDLMKCRERLAILQTSGMYTISSINPRNKDLLIRFETVLSLSESVSALYGMKGPHDSKIWQRGKVSQFKKSTHLKMFSSSQTSTSASSSSSSPPASSRSSDYQPS
ncbi:MAG TPA: tetratricopeptide repeat protein [Gammaproteobacteria bacterium]|nr:tetratricopeptide repeat protein [Gammaproteobacteria bacterium]